MSESPILHFFETMGIRPIDLAVLVGCPIFACLGGWIKIFLVFRDYAKIPTASQINRRQREKEFRKEWLLSYLVISGFTGIIFAFLMVGVVEDRASSIFRLLAVAALAGYSAPAFWRTRSRGIERQAGPGEKPHR